ncbi:hypothetical protein FOPE_12710 [Fonsecaea pedrosoi]|nr:hypothetical protein FOPE_12710 [Fonsecaea pedrosoi]
MAGFTFNQAPERCKSLGCHGCGLYFVGRKELSLLRCDVCWNLINFRSCDGGKDTIRVKREKADLFPSRNNVKLGKSGLPCSAI